MKAGVAFSNDSDPGQAGREAAQQAVAESGSPVFPILFTTDAYAPEAVLNAVKKEIGESKTGWVLLRRHHHLRGSPAAGRRIVYPGR